MSARPLSLDTRRVGIGVALGVIAGCEGPQSTLAPAGREADRVANLFWGMTAGAAVIWVAAIALTLYVMYFARKPLSVERGRTLIMGAGVVAPVVVLGGLLTFSLAMLPDFLAPAPKDAVRVHVTGYQWWWRVRYVREDGEPVELANEIHLPLERATEVLLDAPDVIHSFWIPALGGKVDMIPGRRTRLVLHPTKPGTYRGACAEYCGTSHAWMAFYAVVEERAAFERWLAAQARPAAPPADDTASRGAERFLANGCGACHTVRGTPANGAIGPDLTHVGSRLSIAAGTLGNDLQSFRRFIAHTDEVKPGVPMPAFGMLPREELEAIAAYLEGLR